jgi:hypothetical protein
MRAPRKRSWRVPDRTGEVLEWLVALVEVRMRGAPYIPRRRLWPGLDSLGGPTMRPFLVWLLFAWLLVVGCFPFKVDVGRYTAGTVISKQTQKPIADAEVMYKGHPNTTVLTGTNGGFALDQATVTKWLIPLPIDRFGWQWHPLKVQADGYRALTFEQTNRGPSRPVIIELVPSR